MIKKETTITKNDFKAFKVGTVFNPISVGVRVSKPKYQELTLRYPSRLEAMALDPSKIAFNENMNYTAGQIDFTVKLYKTVNVCISGKKKAVEITGRSPRKVLIRHAVELMSSAIGFDNGIIVDVVDEANYRHCGLGSSSGLIAAVACTLNELFGLPIPLPDLAQYLAQNHGEEIDGSEDLIMPVQCLGGSASCGTHRGGVFILAGQSRVIKAMDLKDDYHVVIGVPKDYTHPDSDYLLEKEIENFDKFIATGQKYGPEIAYRLIHECMPGMQESSLKEIGSLVYDYRFEMGSIANCSFVYPPMIRIAESLKFLKLEGHADVLSISSVGPGFFAVTKTPEICVKAFEREGLNVINTSIHNGLYEVLQSKEFNYED